jgi:hypothetical protein
MSKEKWNIADSDKMSKRVEIANDFYNRVLDPEEHPMFCSDDACFYDLFFGDPKEAKEILKREYGKNFTDTELTMPFWKFLDLLYNKHESK